MEKREISLKKDNRDYVFRYEAGDEDRIIDEVVRLAEDDETDVNWLDAATLGFQLAQQTAVDCFVALSAPATVEYESNTQDQQNLQGSDDIGIEPDDAMDGPCTNSNFP